MPVVQLHINVSFLSWKKDINWKYFKRYQNTSLMILDCLVHVKTTNVTIYCRNKLKFLVPRWEWCQRHLVVNVPLTPRSPRSAHVRLVPGMGLKPHYNNKIWQFPNIFKYMSISLVLDIEVCNTNLGIVFVVSTIHTTFPSGNLVILP